MRGDGQTRDFSIRYEAFNEAFDAKKESLSARRNTRAGVGASFRPSSERVLSLGGCITREGGQSPFPWFALHFPHPNTR